MEPSAKFMKPTPKKVKAELKKLRKFIETTKCPIESRIAYAMEQSIRWATQETVGWPKPNREAVEEANALKVRMAEPTFSYPAIRQVITRK